MGNVLVIRVSAITYDENAVTKAWPFLSALAWPPPLPVEEEPWDLSGAPQGAPQEPEIPEEEAVQEISPEAEDAGPEHSAPVAVEEVSAEASPNPPENSLQEEAAGPTPRPSRREQLKYWLKKLSSPRALAKELWEMKKADGSTSDYSEYDGARGVVNLLRRLVDVADNERRNLDDEVREILVEYAPKFSSLLERLDQALADRDVKRAHDLTNEIEKTLNEAENEFYY